MEENLEGHPAGLNYRVLDYYIALLLALAFGDDQAPTPLPVSEGKG